MANTKISALNALTGANVATNDNFVIVDTSGTETKKITADELRKFLVGTKGIVDSTMTFTATGAATAIQPGAIAIAIQASSDGSHANTTDIDIEGSNDNTLWIKLGTVSVTGASDTDGLGIDLAAWSYIRGNCTSHGDSTNTVTLHLSY
jgi:hypothetical protein